MIWEKRGDAHSIQEVIKANSRLALEEVLCPSNVAPESIEGLCGAAKAVRKAVDNRTPITICGDYDADGITSTAILWLMLRHLGQRARVRLPRRYSEGYGLSMKVVDEISEGLLITVDNGISAIDQIAKAKEKGLTVVILDHHLPGEILPPVDVIVDPHIRPEKNGFVEYCGAGLAYKLAQILSSDNTILLQLVALAAIGTVADVMPLFGDNRVIVREGLSAIRENRIPAGLLSLISEAGLYTIDEDAIGFKIGPALNAAGRLVDNGAMLPLRLLITEDYCEARDLAGQLLLINKRRQALVKEGMRRAYEILEKDGLCECVPICIFDPELLSGIAGLVAGQLAEEYKVPAIVLAPGTKDDLWKGSGRSYREVNLKKILDGAAEFLVSYGGHEGAAGLSIRPENFDALSSRLQQLLSDYEREDLSTIYYDLEIESGDIRGTIDELQKYAPYGQGNPKPILRMDHIFLLPREGAYFRTMGGEQEHIRLNGKEFSIIAFGRANEYMLMGQPREIDAIGFLNKTQYRGMERVEFEVAAFRNSEKQEPQTTALNKALESHLYSFLSGRG